MPMEFLSFHDKFVSHFLSDNQKHDFRSFDINTIREGRRRIRHETTLYVY